MSALANQVAEYLALRRSFGFALKREEQLPGQFVAYLGAAGAETVRSELAIAWAQLPATASPDHWAKRLGIVRRFAVYLRTIDDTVEVPPPGVFPATRCRLTPYLFSERDIERVLEGRPGARPTASRGEPRGALRTARCLRHADRRGNRSRPQRRRPRRRRDHDPAREVRPHPARAAAREQYRALRTYAAERDGLCPRPRAGVFFCSSVGTSLHRSSVDKTFRQITTALGLRTATVRPRVHDLRHGFAVRTLVNWQRSEVSIDRHLVTLPGYLGHVAPSGTYWYLSAVPELMELAASRLEARSGSPR